MLIVRVCANCVYVSHHIFMWTGLFEVLSRGAAQSDVAGGDRPGSVDAGLHQGLAGRSTLSQSQRETQQRGRYHTVRCLLPPAFTILMTK